MVGLAACAVVAFVALGSLAPRGALQPGDALASDATPVRFAVIGDYGANTQAEADVADLVKSWNPDFIITTGDNNYPDGAAATIDANIGQYYHELIAPYSGDFLPGADSNDFFPSLGNHDWLAADAQPYIDYLTLPGNERYYEFVRGPVHFFAIDSDRHEPDGISLTSVQAEWLKGRLRASTAPWKIVYMHHPPYSSGPHGSTSAPQWPYEPWESGWGATAVLAGHDHIYERIVRCGFPYFVNGLGGRSLYALRTPVAGSVERYNLDYGAMLVEATPEQITFKFFTRTGGEPVDSYTMTASTIQDCLLHVAGIDVDTAQQGPHIRATAIVTTLGSDDVPVPNAAVTGDWMVGESLYKGGVAAISDENGVATVQSGPLKGVDASAVHFCVSGVTHVSLPYRPADNAEGASCGGDGPPPPSAPVYVDNVEVSGTRIKARQVEGTAIVTVTTTSTADAPPVVGALVTGDWTVNGKRAARDVSATTNAAGTATIITSRINARGGDVLKFCVTAVSGAYDPTMNVMDCGSIAVP